MNSYQLWICEYLTSKSRNWSCTMECKKYVIWVCLFSCLLFTVHEYFVSLCFFFSFFLLHLFLCFSWNCCSFIYFVLKIKKSIFPDCFTWVCMVHFSSVLLCFKIFCNLSSLWLQMGIWLMVKCFICCWCVL